MGTGQIQHRQPQTKTGNREKCGSEQKGFEVGKVHKYKATHRKKPKVKQRINGCEGVAKEAVVNSRGQGKEGMSQEGSVGRGKENTTRVTRRDRKAGRGKIVKRNKQGRY